MYIRRHHFVNDDRALVGESTVFAIMGITATNADRGDDILCESQIVVTSMIWNVFERLVGDEMGRNIHVMSSSNVH